MNHHSVFPKVYQRADTNTTGITPATLFATLSIVSQRRLLIFASFPIILSIVLLAACGSSSTRRDSKQMPGKFLWAWERPEDLRSIDPNEFGIAFLAQTLFLENDRVMPRPRRQPLDVPPGTYLIAVTRIETNKETTRRPKFDVSMIGKTAFLIKNTLSLPNVKGVQIDFDAVVSEREFYRSMMKELKKQLPPDTPLTMTSLASWCTGDAWFGDFPVDEAVPMVFQMGADSENIKTYLQNGNDWQEPLCRSSYGISLDEGRFNGMRSDRRIFYFSNESWNSSKLP